MLVYRLCGNNFIPKLTQRVSVTLETVAELCGMSKRASALFGRRWKLLYPAAIQKNILLDHVL
eukprot:6603660-Prorocentrum_lima.AAC.1